MDVIESALLTVAWRGNDWDYWTYPREPVVIEGLGTVEVIEVHELGEGDWGGNQHIIFKITAEDGTVRHFKKQGVYRSFEGTEWSYYPFYEVTPVTKHVTAYDYITYKEVQ